MIRFLLATLLFGKRQPATYSYSETARLALRRVQVRSLGEALALMVLCSVAQAEILVTVTQSPAKTVVATKRVLMLADGSEIVLMVEEKQTGTVNVPTVRIVTTAKSVTFSAERSTIVNGEIVYNDAIIREIANRQYAVSGVPGQYRGWISTSDPVNPAEQRKFNFQIEGDAPKPPPDPDPITPAPVVPPDQFDNIGQRVAKLSAGLPKARDVGAVYAKYAMELANNQQMDVVKAISSASAERLALLGADAAKYNEVMTMLNGDLNARWSTMSKGLLSQWLYCVAMGYGVQP